MDTDGPHLGRELLCDWGTICIHMNGPGDCLCINMDGPPRGPSMTRGDHPCMDMDDPPGSSMHTQMVPQDRLCIYTPMVPWDHFWGGPNFA